MKHPNEQGEVGYDKAPLWLTVRIHLKARFIRLFANCYGLYWYLRTRKYEK